MFWLLLLCSLDVPRTNRTLEPEVVPPTPVLSPGTENELNTSSQRELFAESSDPADLGNKVCICVFSGMRE